MMNGYKTARLGLACLLVSTGGCIVRSGEMEVRSVTPDTPTVRSAVRAHLIDGQSVTFPHGVVFESSSRHVVGGGTRWDLQLREVGTVQRIPIDSIAGMETYRPGVNGPATVALTIPAIGLGVVAASGLAAAIFGSCPTFYIDEGGEAVLQAEGFSYSIAPLLESRDVDRLNVQPDASGMIRVEVRNEALETHYLNHIELLELRHGADERVVPDHKGRPLAVGALLRPSVATDRSGRSLLPVFLAVDDQHFETAPDILSRAGPGDLHDHIDLTFPAPAGADSVGLVLRLRNSLLTTVLLYDVMLRRGGPSSLDWLSRELDQVGTALELGMWYTGQMGLHIQMLRDGEYRAVARVSETGPIAWKELAVVLPVDAGTDSVQVRLRFLADNWRIDAVSLAASIDRPEEVVLPVRRVSVADGTSQPEAHRAVSDPDDAYLTTTPGQRYFIDFDSGSPSLGGRTFLLASQGYYSEWMRRDWLEPQETMRPIRPSDDLLVEALDRWRTRKPGFEEEFYSSKIAVR